MIGIAFSLGFTVGPLLGAYFAVSSKTSDNIFFQSPALLALAFSVGDLFFIWFMLPETLKVDAKVGVWIILTVLKNHVHFYFKEQMLLLYRFTLA